jgi:hypothetical protein
MRKRQSVYFVSKLGNLANFPAWIFWSAGRRAAISGIQMGASSGSVNRQSLDFPIYLESAAFVFHMNGVT